jgi:hypothetical protein
MYLSRLTFHTQPGKTRAVESELCHLMAMVSQVGGLRVRVWADRWVHAAGHKPHVSRSTDMGRLTAYTS